MFFYLVVCLIVHHNVLQDSRLSTWDMVCTEILGHQLHIWSTFASTVFVSRVEVVWMIDSR